MFGLRYFRNVTTLRFFPERCNGCGMCLQVCPTAVFARDGKRVVVSDADACIECGACQLNCEPKAISVNPGVGCAAAVLASKLGSGSPERAAPCCGPGDSCNPGCC
ncbi:MAG: 4Fe-4S dicluster domain-containing protein [Deltaproteobacteria bacterium]|nr:MAG: 4Fe-4S dicluster domain-containing protein [Deltaproteobacteria bacterium]